ncbi:hypothetical protein [Winogradskyella helgolandensis]|uniref:hypothetical protein n=1 Tax=Winogradskyella helgolandensis TaxID=2697010 RepID=UPI0015BE540D|nr:hypothetical protein [Winogradskyella helgolandensis]
MNRDYHLSFCKVCTKRKRNLENGIICSLTNKIADFKDNCPSYDFDKLEFQNYEKRFQNEVSDNYTTKGIEKLIGVTSFEKPAFSRFSKYNSIEKTQNLVFRYNGFYGTIGIITILLIIVGLISTSINDVFNLTGENIILLFFVLILLSICVLKFVEFSSKKKLKITVNPNGIEYQNNSLSWNSIFDFGILQINKENTDASIILIGTITKGNVKIDLTDFNVNSEDLYNIIELNTKNVLQHRV